MFSHLLLPPERPRGWRDPAEVVSQSPLSPPLARPLLWAARSSARAHAHTHTIPPPCVHPPPSQVVAVARWGSPWAAEGRAGEGARTARRCEERGCARPEPGRRVTAPGYEGPALTGKSGHRGGGSEGTRDGSALGGGSKQGGLCWQRTVRGRPAGSRTGLKRREARSASAPPRPRLSCPNFRLSSTRPPRPKSTTSSPPSAPALASVSPGRWPRGGDQEPPALRCGREAAAGGEEKLGGAREPEGGAAGGKGRRGASSPRLSPPTSSSCGCPFRARSSRSCQAPGPRRCRRRRRRWGLPAPPSRPRRKWTASPGNRCARRRGRSAPRARRSSAARAARRSCTPCPSSKVTSEGAAPGGSAGARPRASRAISSRGFLLPRWGLQWESCFPRCFPPPPPESNRFALQSFAAFLFPDSPELFPS